MARMSIRIDLDQDGRLGPGKVELLERIAECGSISAAGRAMSMSYRRAWELVADLSANFAEPLVVAQAGGRQGGGARITAFGAQLVAQYRAIEREAQAAVAPRLKVLEEAASEAGKEPPQSGEGV